MSLPQNEPEKNPKGGPPNKGPKFNFYWLYGLIIVAVLAVQFIPMINSGAEEITYYQFQEEMLKAHDVEKIVIINDKNVNVYIKPERLELDKYKEVAETGLGTVNQGPHYSFTIGDLRNFENNLDEAQAKFKPEERIAVHNVVKKDWFSDTFGILLPILIIVAIWFIIMRRVSGGMGGGGGQIFNIGRSKATLFDKDTKVNVSFSDVAGLDEAKEEVKEIVDFLKNPQKYTALGGKIPKGALLVGPPGTGKTLLAKAMAGEAQVPFFSLSGSDFVEMFVGVGASRVRDLFKQAKEKAPCIIFIDEIDAIGRARGKNLMQSNDERENTLNQLLVEMDGFGTDSGVIILAATNRPDVLDNALLRPGRFDRQISIDRPDLKGREAIFKVHLKPIKVSEEIDAAKLAAQTPGFAGAEIANVCNEAALIAARKDKTAVEMDDFQDAIDRVIGGLEKKNKIISPEEKKIIAFHEAGHAICGWYFEHASPLVKVSIVPRGVAALGYAQYLPKEQYLYSTEQLMDEMCTTLGGRAAEDLVFKSITTGAQNDLERITQMAYAMITVYGMNEKVGNVSFYDPQKDYSFNKPYSEETAHLIDNEVKALIEKCYVRTKKLLLDKKEDLEKVAHELLEKEIIFQADMERLIGKRPFNATEPIPPKPNGLDIAKKPAEKETPNNTTEKKAPNAKADKPEGSSQAYTPTMEEDGSAPKPTNPDASVSTSDKQEGSDPPGDPTTT